MQSTPLIPIVDRAYRHVLSLLQPVKHYSYHNIGHTLDVFRRVRVLANSEWVNDTEQIPLLLAALFHDTGFRDQYDKNEVIWAQYARKWLEKEWYPESWIREVERLIMATIVFSPAPDIFAQILQDADLDNFGRSDCMSKMFLVQKELEAHTPLSQRQIYDIFRFLQPYNFQTKTARAERQAKRTQNRAEFGALYTTKFWENSSLTSH